MENKYRVIYYYSEEDECYLTFAPELPGCCSEGNDLREAIDNLYVVISEWIETAIEIGREVPEPMQDTYETSHADIFSVSKYILEKTGSISTMTLEKLTYYCLAWSLVWFNQPLFDNKFQAWRRGPVCKELFDSHKGKRVISAEMIDSSHILSIDEKKIIDCVLSVYGNENGEFLSSLTHNEKPWNVTRENLSPEENCEKIIKNELIRESYMY
ncbi:MAG: DUF4065 domain-containing protein [Lachnospiraceae bacterium]|nr:DUF4065 domain-containing protein [Lachnospiraceae bacterium]